jgi:adenylate cyclase associated (CAP) protein
VDKLEEALARLERAVARLEAAASPERPAPGLPGARQIDDPKLRAIAGEIAARVDGALAKIGRILGEAG